MRPPLVSPADVELAHDLATSATQVALDYFNATVRWETKGDGTPLSAADLAVERTLIDQIHRLAPSDAILSEEAGQIGMGRRRWILDPIDGTVAFLAGQDAWGTHVALEVDGELHVAIITRPVAGRRWWGVRGQGAYTDTGDTADRLGRPLAVSAVSSLADARVGVFATEGSPVPSLIAAVGAAVVQGGSIVLDLLEGHLDAIVSHNCGFAWDHAPAVVLVAEAGGRFSDPCGGTRFDLQGGLYTNGLLDIQLLAVLGRVWSADRA
jgi:histidinol-phosphatase